MSYFAAHRRAILNHARREGLYSIPEISNMINTQGYIPIALPAEFHSMPLNGSRIMGAGTIWEGTYTTGAGQKYIQVRHLDFINTTTSLMNYLHGFTYDGNMLNSTNITINNIAIFTAATNSNSCFIRNVKIEYFGNMHGLVLNIGNNSIIENITATANITSNNTTAFASGFVGFVLAGTVIRNITYTGNVSTPINSPISGIGLFISVAEINVLIENCVITGNITGGAHWVGLIAAQNNGIINNIKVHGNINITANYDVIAGLAVGEIRAGSVTQISASGIMTITNDVVNRNNQCGGLVGSILSGVNNNLQNSFAHVDVLTQGRYVGGVVGVNRGNIINCYSTGRITGGDFAVGGSVGWNGNSVINTYFDRETAGIATSAAGLPRSTAQMQVGTASSFIRPDGTIDTSNLSDNAMYINWLNDIWDFQDTNQYPILR